MTDIEKARDWMEQHDWPTHPDGCTPLERTLAAYGAHCAREAEQERDVARNAAIEIAKDKAAEVVPLRFERDALAYEVAQLRVALTTVRASLTGMRIAWRETCDTFHVPASSMHQALGQSFEALEETRPFLTRPTASRVQPVAAGMALAEAEVAYVDECGVEGPIAKDLPKQVWQRLKDARDAYRAARGGQ